MLHKCYVIDVADEARGGVELARVLLMAGLVVNPNSSSPPPTGFYKRTPILRHAIMKRYTGMIKLLIVFGADLSAVVPAPHRQNRPRPQFIIQDALAWWSAKNNAILLELVDLMDPSL
jgi:hypothetical protein